jgi:hypothetical protein
MVALRTNREKVALMSKHVLSSSTASYHQHLGPYFGARYLELALIGVFVINTRSAALDG